MSASRAPLEVTLDRAGVEDARAILDLQRRAYQSEAELYGDCDIPPLTQTLAQMEADIREQTVLKAVLPSTAAPGTLVGSVRAYARGDTAYIGRLIVEPELQNRGLGTRLMHAIEAAFPQVARYELFTGHRSVRNLYLYRKLGYTPFKVEPVTDDLQMVYLEKVRS